MYRNEKTVSRFLVKALMLGLILAACSLAADAKGKKFALLVGVNKYPDTIGQLGGCVNDVLKMKTTLTTRYGFVAANTTTLTDAQATRQAIIDKIKMYQGLAGAGDIFVMHYSGHGSLFPDEYSEVRDESKLLYYEDPDTGEVVYPRGKYDANILPVDADGDSSGKPWGNLILDDELYAMFSEFTAKGAQVVFISDSCFSGSVARRDMGKDVKERFVPLSRVFHKKSYADLKFKKPAKQRTATAPPDLRGLYLTLSGANDTETALDGGTGAVRMGLFTSKLVEALNKPAALKMNYAQLMTLVGQNVRDDALNKQHHNQNPRLETAYGNPGALIFSVPAAK